MPQVLSFLASRSPSHTLPAPPAGPGATISHRVVAGIPWTPEEFVDHAKGIEHPRHIMAGLPAESQEAISKLVEMSAEEVGRHRTGELRKC